MTAPSKSLASARATLAALMGLAGGALPSFPSRRLRRPDTQAREIARRQAQLAAGKLDFSASERGIAAAKARPPVHKYAPVPAGPARRVPRVVQASAPRRGDGMRMEELKSAVISECAAHRWIPLAELAEEVGVSTKYASKAVVQLLDSGQLMRRAADNGNGYVYASEDRGSIRPFTRRRSSMLASWPPASAA